MVIWLIGLSGAGKTVIGQELFTLFKQNNNCVFIDGDIIRDIFNNDLGHSLEDRKKNSRRISRLCHFLSRQNISVVCSILSISHEDQQWNRENIDNYYEVFIDVPLEVLLKRDTKGLYEKALKGEISDVVGVDIEFNDPPNADLVINNTGENSVIEIAKNIFKSVSKIGF